MRCAPYRVLVLDDEPGIGRLIAAALANHVAEVFTQPSLALKRAAEVRFDFVFCDYSMPEMTGAAFHDALRGVQPHLARRFVLMTGSASCAEISHFLSRTGIELLQKPFELRELEPLLDAVLARAEEATDVTNREQLAATAVSPPASAGRLWPVPSPSEPRVRSLLPCAGARRPASRRPP
jgi:DNA-binding NtrC family response regulator